MTAFLIAVGLLTAVVVGRLLWPLWRGARRSTLTIAQLNSTVYRDQLRELERDLARGQLTEPAYQEARDELQRRLLQDVSASAGDVAGPATAAPSRWTAVALALLVPLGAALLYGKVGNSAAIDAPTQAGITPEGVQRAVSNLAEALRKSPDNPQGWVLLARAYRQMGRFADSAAAYDHAASLIDTNPDLLVEQADVLAASQGNSLEGKPLVLVNKALALDANHAMGLMLVGTAAFQRGDPAGAVAPWEKLLAQLPPDSDEARQVQANIEQARADGALAPAAAAGTATPMAAASAPDAAPAKVPAAAAAPRTAAAASATPAPAAAAGTVSGEVSVSPALATTLRPDDVVFIIARPADGSRAPLAVLRKRAADLPLRFTLDDSLAMMPERTVSKAASVIVVARVSRSGEPIPQKGDLTSEPSAPVAPGASGLQVRIDREL